MIKLNLLPQYVIEVRRIRVVIVLFLVLLVLEAAIIFKAYTDLNLQVAWYTSDMKYFTDRTAMIQQEKSARDALVEEAKIYRPYIDFFTRNAIIKYNDEIAASLAEAANAIGGGKTWFDSLTVAKTGEVAATGHIKGMINFLDYYFVLKAKMFTLIPQAQPARSPAQKDWTIYNELPVQVTGKITKIFPAAPGVPATPDTPDKLYVPNGGGGAAAGGAPAGGPATGGAPGGGAPGGAAGAAGGARGGGPGGPAGGAPGGGRGGA